MNQFSALIFDMDGVIVDTEALHAEAKRTTFEHYQLEVPENLYAEFRGRSDEDMVEHVVREFGPARLSAADVLNYKHAVFRTLHEKVAPVDGVLDFIRQARRHFDKLAVTTSATKDNQEFTFDKFDLQPYFDVVVTAKEIRRTKPHPDPYLITTRQLGLDPASCLVIEDSKNGILSAKAAGCVVVAITTSFSKSELKEANAEYDYVVDSYPELVSLLKIR